MRRVYYNKLVRDRIKEKIEKNGEVCEIRVIEDDAEFQQELFKKVREEATAFAQIRTREEFLDEYSDITAALDALVECLGFSKEEIQEARQVNMDKKGGYTKKHFLHWSQDMNYKSNETPQGIN